MRSHTALLLFAAFAAPLVHAQWKDIFNGRNLDGWEAIGACQWHVMADGTLVGKRDPRKDFPADWPLSANRYNVWLNTQAWLYTKKDYGQFDLHVEYWLPAGGNSGISLRDPSRASFAVSTPPDFSKTPAKLGYEIQLNCKYPDDYASGSIYTFVKAKTGVQKDEEWNSLDIEVRDDIIRVRLNGELVAEHATDPKRPKTGPIGLQLHDQFSLSMFRNIRLQER